MASTSTLKNCGNCAFYDMAGEPMRKFNKPWRQCRGAVPSLEPNPQFGITRGAFPYMPEDGWCGVFQPRDDRAVAVVVGKPEVV